MAPIIVTYEEAKETIGIQFSLALQPNRATSELSLSTLSKNFKQSPVNRRKNMAFSAWLCPRQFMPYDPTRHGPIGPILAHIRRRQQQQPPNRIMCVYYTTPSRPSSTHNKTSEVPSTKHSTQQSPMPSESPPAIKLERRSLPYVTIPKQFSVIDVPIWHTRKTCDNKCYGHQDGCNRQNAQAYIAAGHRVSKRGRSIYQNKN
eukprot:scaffold13641_cov42-Cyclotella_meneghiniana.AAC.1